MGVIHTWGRGAASVNHASRKATQMAAFAGMTNTFRLSPAFDINLELQGAAATTCARYPVPGQGATSCPNYAPNAMCPGGCSCKMGQCKWATKEVCPVIGYSTTGHG